MKAREESKHLLVSIQKRDDFLSMELNRDVWNNETLEEMIQANFVFWLRDDVPQLVITSARRDATLPGGRQDV